MIQPPQSIKLQNCPYSILYVVK